MINIHVISDVKISKFSNTRIVDSKCEDEFIEPLHSGLTYRNRKIFS